MTIVVRTSKRADRQISAALKWWRENRDKAPRALFEELERAMALLAAAPRVGTLVHNTRRRGARRFFLERVRYDLYYEVRGDALVILALWHRSRRPPRL